MSYLEVSALPYRPIHCSENHAYFKQVFIHPLTVKVNLGLIAGD